MQGTMVDIAGAELSQLIQQLEQQQEIILTKDEKPVAKLVSIPNGNQKGGFGSGKEDILFIAEDFDETPDDFKDYLQ